jgi:hypothetical protein
VSGHYPDAVRKHRAIRTTTSRCTRQRDSKRRKEKNIVNVDAKTELCTAYPQSPDNGGVSGENIAREERAELREPECHLDPTPEELEGHIRECQQLVREWNEHHTAPFEVGLTRAEYRQLFCGGNRKHKIALCCQASQMQGEKPDYPGLVIRAFTLMLRESERRRIGNPFGWLWSCLHGNSDGSIPWVVGLTAAQERAPPRRTVC